METRETTSVWLVGQPNSDILGCRLPTKSQVMRNFFHHQKSKKCGRIRSMNLCLDAALVFWNKARIPTMRRDSALRKIDSLLKRYDGLVRNRYKPQEQHRMAEQMFQDEIKNEILDIGHAQALSLMTNDEDKTFYVSQQEDPGKSSMGSVDVKLHKKEVNKQHRNEIERTRKEQEETRKKRSRERVALEDSSSSAASEDDEDFELPDICKASTSRTPVRKQPKNCVDEVVAVAYDRMKVSYRNAAMSYALVARSLGHDLNDISVSCTTMYRARQAHRRRAAEEYQAEEFCPGEPLILHWDGKLLPDGAGVEQVDRIAVVVTGGGEEKLLGIPKVSSGTGVEMARVGFELVQEHQLAERVKGLSFDTTASNTGCHIGACVKFEELLGRELLYLACRHHVYEVVLSRAAKSAMGPTTGPDNKLFNKLQREWDSLDKTDVTTASDTPSLNVEQSETLSTLKRRTVMVIKEALAHGQPRDDYKELLELVLIFLGEITVNQIRLKRPGAHHHARWMAKGIYVLKLFLLQRQFQMTSDELNGITSICLFVALVYSKAWALVSRAHLAPGVDLEFLQDLEALEREGSCSCAQAARDAMMRHLWYLSETLVGLAFFDQTVSQSEKESMVANLRKPAKKKALKRLEKKNMGPFEGKKLSDFVTSRTVALLEVLNLDSAFLSTPVQSWEQNEAYMASRQRITRLAVVNDSAERAIALIKEFNSALTTSEDQRQLLLKAVYANRKNIGEKTKKALMP